MKRTFSTRLWIILTLVLLLGGGVFYMTDMPGDSHASALPPLSADEMLLRDRLERHVTVLAGVGERNVWRHEALEKAAGYIEETLRDMGYTVAAALCQLGPRAQVVVAELVPAVVEWVRGPLADLAGRPLDDPRVAVQEIDVAHIIEAQEEAWDAILLDVDNGPAALTVDANERLYGASGLGTIRRCLRPGGVLGVWSSDPDRAFERRLARAGFQVSTETVPARRGGKGPKHTIFVAQRH